jgi:hypothetical protein
MDGTSEFTGLMRHAFLITAYKDPDALVELIDDLGPSAMVHIHWDRKSRISKDDIRRISAKDQVKTFSRRYKVNWGSTRHLLAILDLARQAILDPEVERVHAITGSDRPILPPDKFTVFFNQHRQSEFIAGTSLPTPSWEGGGLQRLTLYHPLDFLDVKRLNHARVRNLFLKIQRLSKVQRSLREMPPLYGGSTWWSLTRECLAHMLHRIDSDGKILRRMRMTHIPEEILFHTLIMDSPFAQNVVGDDLRYIDWNERNGNVPAVLDITDLPKILASGKLFARKLERPISTELIAQLRKHRAH